MDRNEYNGWTNRATWLVNVWFDPQSAADVDWIEDSISEEYDKLSGFFKDMISIDDIDWDQLRNHFDDADEDDADDDVVVGMRRCG